MGFYFFVGRRPSPPSSLSDPFISQFDHGRRDQPNIALTFDADMTPAMVRELETGQIKSWYNSAVIDVLHQYQTPATIFVTGLWAQQYPQITKQLSQDPLIEIGNHSYSHPAFTPNCYELPKVGDKTDEITQAQRIIGQITGRQPALFRFPGGCYSTGDVKLANTNHLTVVGWDDASSDAFNTNLDAIVRHLRANTQNGSVLVFHLDGNRNAPQTVNALKEIIPYLQARGFHFLTVSELMAASRTSAP